MVPNNFQLKLVWRMQGLDRPGKILELDLGPGKLLEFENSAFCPGNVLEFCKIALETEIILENIKIHQFFSILLDICDT